MTRTAGARNADFELRRTALIAKAMERLSLQTGEPPSFRELALAAGVSVTTLRHYFGSREDLIKAVFEHYLQAGQRHLRRTRAPVPETVDLEDSLKEFLTRLVQGWSGGHLGSLHRIGLSEGLRNPQTALAYLMDVLEPTLQALEQRLRNDIEAGVIVDCETPPCRVDAAVAAADGAAAPGGSRRHALPPARDSRADRRTRQGVCARLPPAALANPPVVQAAGIGPVSPRGKRRRLRSKFTISPRPM